MCINYYHLKILDRTRIKTIDTTDKIITISSIQINNPSLYEITVSFNVSIPNPIIIVNALINMTPTINHIDNIHTSALFTQKNFQILQINANFNNMIDIIVPTLIIYIYM